VRGEKSLARLASGFVFLLANPEFYSHLASGYPHPWMIFLFHSLKLNFLLKLYAIRFISMSDVFSITDVWTLRTFAPVSVMGRSDV
jgi:hypothetical protein